MRRFARLAALLAVLLATFGCDHAGNGQGPNVPAAAMPVLAPSAVPGVPSVTTLLTAADLARDASLPGLAAKIASWGYLGGRQRTFQGESHHLTLVVSRALMFRSSAGAHQYVSFVREHQTAFFGAFAQPRHLTGRGLSGWLFIPPLCACHLANPALIGTLSTGTRVIWLEINGPAATPALLERLLGLARNIAGHTG
jgi:hypothetical protein